VHSCTNHKAAVSLTPWVCAHERFEKVRIQLRQPLFHCAPRYARDMSNLHANQLKEIVLFNIFPPIWQRGLECTKGEDPKEQLAQQTRFANLVFSLINHDRPHLFPNFYCCIGSSDWVVARVAVARVPLLVHVTRAARALLVI
jgi:hypothetical protein